MSCVILTFVNVLNGNRLGHWGATAIDSLDTMLLMGLDDLFNATKPFVASLTFDEVRLNDLIPIRP